MIGTLSRLPRLSTEFNKVAVPPAGNERALWNGPVTPRSGQYVSCVPVRTQRVDMHGMWRQGVRATQHGRSTRSFVREGLHY